MFEAHFEKGQEGSWGGKIRPIEEPKMRGTMKGELEFKKLGNQGTKGRGGETRARMKP